MVGAGMGGVVSDDDDDEQKEREEEGGGGGGGGGGRGGGGGGGGTGGWEGAVVEAYCGQCWNLLGPRFWASWGLRRAFLGLFWASRGLPGVPLGPRGDLMNVDCMAQVEPDREGRSSWEVSQGNSKYNCISVL